MSRARTAMIVSSAVYAVGVIIVVILCAVALHGPNEALFPNSLNCTSRDEAAFGLAFGAIPMLAACAAVYHFGNLKSSPIKVRWFLLVFAPGFVCSAFALFIVGLIFLIMANAVLHFR